MATAASTARRWTAEAVLNAGASFWFVAAAIGQWAFVSYIAAFYGGAAARGDPGAWNDVLVGGYVRGGTFGNVVLAAHLVKVARELGNQLRLLAEVGLHAEGRPQHQRLVAQRLLDQNDVRDKGHARRAELVLQGFQQIKVGLLARDKAEAGQFRQAAVHHAPVKQGEQNTLFRYSEGLEQGTLLSLQSRIRGGNRQKREFSHGDQ